MTPSTSATGAGVPVNLLWTAGWDSTFRLLDLAVRQARPVVPHYIVDPGRQGTLHELRAMRAIRERVARDHAGRERLIAPTQVTLIDSIAPDAELTAQFQRLKARAYLGSQYDWLARFVAQHGLDTLELCIHADDRAEGFVRGHVEHVPVEGDDGYWQMRREVLNEDVGLFGHFRFPILTLTKTEMRERARAAGFGRLMALTWFCHTPIDGRPCGLCNPCRYTIAEGLAERLPGRALLRHRFSGQLRTTRKLIGPFYRALAGMARPLIRRERGQPRVARA